MSWNQQQPWGQSSRQQPSFISADIRDDRVSAFLSKVYGWMFVGLLIRRDQEGEIMFRDLGERDLLKLIHLIDVRWTRDFANGEFSCARL
jgi:hypothetical protein